MTAIKGLEVYLATDQALAQAQALAAAVDRVADSIERMGGGVDKADQSLSRAAKRQQELATEAQKLDSATKELGDSQEALGKQAQQGARSFEGTAAAGRRAGAGIRQAGQSASQTTRLLQLLLNVSGKSGASGKLDLLRAAAGNVVHGLNPMGIAVGVASTALAVLVAKALDSNSPLEQLRKQARAAQEDFSQMARGIRVAGEALGGVASARDRFSLVGSASDEAKRLAGLVNGIEVAQSQIGDARRRAGGDFELPIDEIEKLGEALGKPARFFRDLQAATSKSTEERQRAIAVLEQEIGLEERNGAIVLDASKAQEQLAKAYQEAKAQRSAADAQAYADSIVDSTKALSDLVGAQQRSIELEKLGASERSAQAAIDEQRAKLKRELTVEEQRFADQLVKTARTQDQDAERRRQELELLAKQKAAQAEAATAAEAARKEKEQAVRAFDKSKEALQLETALLYEDGAARDALRMRLELEAQAKEALGQVDRDTRIAIDQLVEAYGRARAAEEQRTKATQDATKAAREQERAEERRVELFRQLGEEEKLVRLTGEEYRRYAESIAAANDALGAGLEVGSAAYNEYVQRRAALAELSAEQQRNNALMEESKRQAESFGQSIGQSVGTALERLIFDGAKARDVMRALFDDLARQAFQQSVTQNLSRLFGSALGSLFGGPSAAAAAGSAAGGGFTPGAGFSPYLTGGVIPAMDGQIVDQPSYLARANRIYSVAEGGATTPEVVMRLARDQRGNLGVAAVGGDGGGGNTFVFPGVRNRQDARAVRATMSQRANAFMAAANRRGRRGLRPQ